MDSEPVKPSVDSLRSWARAQSAMEYLMTYGWAILIIAVVLAALFSLGVFAPRPSNSCVGDPGFLCSGIQFSTNLNDFCGVGGAYTGFPSMNVIIGSTSNQWNNVFLAVVPQGQSITGIGSGGSKTDFKYWGTVTGHWAYISSLLPGQQSTVSICVNPNIANPTIGSSFQGQIWAMYSTSFVTNALVEVGRFSVTASR